MYAVFVGARWDVWCIVLLNNAGSVFCAESCVLTQCVGSVCLIIVLVKSVSSVCLFCVLV